MLRIAAFIACLLTIAIMFSSCTQQTIEPDSGADSVPVTAENTTEAPLPSTQQPNDESQTEPVQTLEAHTRPEFMPEISSFSSEHLEDYEWQFSNVEYALFSHDGIEEKVLPDDPRLIRLLNYIAFSENVLAAWLVQGYVEEDEITSSLRDHPTLDVFFQSSPPRDDVLGDIPHVIIGQDMVFLYQKDDQIEQHWPYMEYYNDLVESGDVSEETFQEKWSSDYDGPPWLDLLQLSGFVQE